MELHRVDVASWPPLKLHSYTRTMKLKEDVVTELMRRWLGRAHEACALVGKVHYWITAVDETASEPYKRGPLDVHADANRDRTRMGALAESNARSQSICRTVS